MDIRPTIWHAAPVEEVLAALATDRRGLTGAEAERRHREYGPNALPRARRVPPMTIFLNQFRSSLISILVVAGLISLALGHRLDAIVIGVAISLNVLVGFLQEVRAYGALEKLRIVIERTAVVFRDGTEHVLPVQEVVPGDVLRITAGDDIPADARILSAIDFSVQESTLTGEPFAVEKAPAVLPEDTILSERRNMLFSGTTATEGSGTAMVVSTGQATELGTVVQLARETPEEATPLQKRLAQFSRWLTVLVIGLSAVVFGIGAATGNDLGEMFLTAVAIAVAAIPEGLLIGVTVVLTVGMQRILRKRALVRKLIAAETLGATTVICTDKTGTLTEGLMHVAQIVTANEILERPAPDRERHAAWMLTIGMLCNDAFVENEDDDLAQWIVVGNPTERALLVAGDKLGLRKSKLTRSWKRLATIPFDSDRKYMVTLHHDPKGGKQLFAKGAPERILAMSAAYPADDHEEKLTEEKRATILASFEKYSGRGLRLLALAFASIPEEEKDLRGFSEKDAGMIFAGYVGIKDPLRAEAQGTVAEVRRAGVQVVMMTGDHPLTAGAIAEELGIPNRPENIIDGAQLAKLPDHELTARITDLHIYARMTPKDKLRIIDAWQAHGAVVAMTGDGSNDAPALRSADIGIALGSGTDLAKDTANLVLLDNNFRTIVSSVREGRLIYENIRKVVLYLLSDSLSAVTMVVGSILFGLPLPLAPAQILWTNLVTDGFPHLSLTVEPEEDDVMQKAPRPKNEAIVSKDMRRLVLVISLTTGLLSLGMFALVWFASHDLSLARTMAFASLGLSSILYIFSVRAMRRSVLSVNPFKNRLLLAAVAAGILAQIAAVSIPPIQGLLGTTALEPLQWLTVVGTALLTLAIIEVVKYVVVLRRQRIP